MINSSSLANYLWVIIWVLLIILFLETYTCLTFFSLVIRTSSYRIGIDKKMYVGFCIENPLLQQLCIVCAEIHVCHSFLSYTPQLHLLLLSLPFRCSSVLKRPHFSLAVNVLSEFGSWLARLFGGSASKSSQNGQTVPVNLSPLQVRWCLQKS